MAQYIRTSEMLNGIIQRREPQTLIAYDVAEMFEDRGFAVSLLVLSLLLLMLPGRSYAAFIVVIPIWFIAVRMLLGRRAMWLPRKLGYKRFSQAALAARLQRFVPMAQKMERWVMPRMEWAVSPPFEQLLGAWIIVVALFAGLPIAGGFLPCLCMVLMALGLLEKDGLFVLCSTGLSMFCVALLSRAAFALI